MNDKCMILIAKEGQVENLKQSLQEEGISYSFDEDIKIFFANVKEIPQSIKNFASIYDPVFLSEGKWHYNIPEEAGIYSYISNAYNSEHDARVAFVIYVSWYGEFYK